MNYNDTNQQQPPVYATLRNQPLARPSGLLRCPNCNWQGYEGELIDDGVGRCPTCGSQQLDSRKKQSDGK